MQTWLRAVWLSIFLLLLPWASLAASRATSETTEQQAFLAALTDLQRRDQAQFLIIADHLRNYPLYPYLIYADLALHLPQATPEQLQGFLTAYQDTPLANHLRSLWLNQLAAQSQWQAFLKVYQPSSNIELQCLARQALWHAGKKNQALDQLALLFGKNIIPKPCLWVMGQALSSGSLGEQLVWDSIQRAFNSNNLLLAEELSHFLPPDQKKGFILWHQVSENPLLILNTALLNEARELKENIVLTAIQKLTRNNPRLAAQVWARTARQLPFNDNTQGQVIKIIALGLAEDHDPLAPQWLDAVPAGETDTSVREWQIRDALWRQDWTKVEKDILLLPQKDRQTSIWRYWLARALNAQGKVSDANNIYRDLSLKGDFYGQLASLCLNQKPLMSVENLQVNKGQINAIAGLPAMQRARELYQLHWLPEAGQEWHWAISHMPEEDYLASAELAIHWGWFERAIATVNLINDGANIPLRFPLAYRQPVLQAALRNNLNPAWLFALIRQESLFTADARSSAGAIGLMQLLPSTASLIASKIHLPVSRIDLKDAGTNLVLGSIFLKKLTVQFNGNEVFATAAYNAGPNRVKKWLPAQPMSIDIWIENIPYHETRTYVKNIMTSTTFYEKELGLPLSLIQKVKPV
jgi:soluble lytic murein transglycosylase